MRLSLQGCGPVLFVLLATVFILQTYAADYNTFLKNHYNNPKSNVGNRYCDAMMQRRGLTRPQCKAVNTFIHASKKQIRAVCGSGGRPYGNGLRRSIRQFSVTTCKITGGSNRPPCRYRENSSQRFIILACRGGFPVHYDEGQI